MKRLLGLLLAWIWIPAASAIVGFTEGPFPPDHPGAFNEVAILKAIAGGGHKIFCSGFILNRWQIASAKHCVAEKDAKDLAVYFGEDTTQIDSRLFREVESYEVFFSSDWMSAFPSGDQAIITLTKPIPNADGSDPTLPHFRAVPLLLDPTVLINKNYEQIELVGHGNRSAEFMHVEAGLRKRTATDFASYVSHPQFFSLTILEGELGHGNCHGDSGGPAYAKIFNENTQKSEWVVFGGSAGFDLALTPRSYVHYDDDVFPHLAYCDKSQTIYTFVGDYYGWLSSYAKEPIATVGTYTPSSNRDKFLWPEGTEGGDKSHRSFADWCRRTNLTEPGWKTIRQLLIFAMESNDQDADQDIALDCERAEKVLAGISSLTFEKESLFDSLAPLTSLRLDHLGFKETAIPDLTSLAGYKLPSLSIQGVGLKSLNDLPGLDQIEAMHKLDLSGNQLRRLDELTQLSELTEVNLSHNRIETVHALSQLPELLKLNISNNEIRDISPLLQHTELESLTAFNNKIQSPRLTAAWPNLKVLELQHNQLEDIGFLKNVTQLVRLSLSSNNVTDLSPLGSHSQLQHLLLAKNRIEPATMPLQLPALLSLDVASNQLSSVGFVRPYRRLQKLIIASNRIESLVPLFVLPELRVLFAGGNPIRPGSCPAMGTEVLKRVCRNL